MPQLSPASLFVDHKGVVINKQPVRLGWGGWGFSAAVSVQCLAPPLLDKEMFDEVKRNENDLGHLI